jgi:uncharacterized Tic20 family protein
MLLVLPTTSTLGVVQSKDYLISDLFAIVGLVLGIVCCAIGVFCNGKARTIFTVGAIVGIILLILAIFLIILLAYLKSVEG